MRSSRVCLLRAILLTARYLPAASCRWEAAFAPSPPAPPPLLRQQPAVPPYQPPSPPSSSFWRPQRRVSPVRHSSSSSSSGGASSAVGSKQSGQAYRDAVHKWVKDVVVGLKLCPWAGPAMSSNSIKVLVHEGEDLEALLHLVVSEATRLEIMPEHETGTTLVAAPHVLGDFEDFLDFIGMVEECMQELQVTDRVQLAHFHPKYQFGGVEEDDVTNYTNRSPMPILHLLREVEVSRAVEQYEGETARIYERNQQLMRTMGTDKIRSLLSSCQAHVDSAAVSSSSSTPKKPAQQRKTTKKKTGEEQGGEGEAS